MVYVCKYLVQYKGPPGQKTLLKDKFYNLKLGLNMGVSYNNKLKILNAFKDQWLLYHEWLRFKRGTIQLDWFIFIWFSLIVNRCRDNYKYIIHSVSCTHTDSLAFHVHVLCIRFAKHTLFDLGASLSPRLSVFCTFSYLNLFCSISTQTNFCCPVCFIFTAIYCLLKNTLR